jgi:peptide/nickel transport system ATP-binding protein
MRQRVVLALAFACDPKLVVADEPTTALDVSIQAQVIGLLKRMCRDHGTAVLLITHDMGVIADTADRIAVMYAGRMVEVGPTRQVLKAPSHPYTQGLMASIPSMRRRGATLAQIEGSMPRLDSLPRGCPFHPRCTVKIARCESERPDLMPEATGEAACWLVESAPRAAGANASGHG